MNVPAPTPDPTPLAAHAAHAESAEAVLAALESDSTAGLSGREAKKRNKGYGPNLLRRRRPRETWRILVAQFKGPIVWLLLAAAAVSLAFGQWKEGIAIILVLLINGIIGFVTEIRAVRSMEALRRMATVATRVRRDGRIKEVPAQSLVPGDIVVLDGGDMVTADLRLIEAANLHCDESALTGESLPVTKGIDALPPNTPLADRLNMAFKGTAITRGTGLAIVVATGMATELGRISALVEEAEDEFSPLEKRLAKLSSQLIWLTLGMTVLIAGLGIAAGEDVLLMIQAGVALAVAAIPEGLPIVATLTLARGMFRMAKRNALIERLTAVETLGATTVIFTDKTGTLTENRMTVSHLLLADASIDLATENTPENAAALHALRAGVLCNNAQLGPDGGIDGAIGDPMEVALLVAAAKIGLDRNDIVEDLPEVREVAFDSESKMMATVHRDDDAFLIAVKGAPESVIARAAVARGTDEVRPLDDAARADWLRRANELAGQGLRTLALAERSAGDAAAPAYEGLVLLGLVGLLDPPRADVRGAIEACHGAGITVVMVTGDHAVTGHNIARAVGLASADSEVVEGRDLKPPQTMTEAERDRLRQARVFARVSPKQKLDLIAAYQEDGAVVAMTGDGVNDAPALKKADIGIAMGQRGTQVAREAADMVLRDDAFPTIVEAISQGRVIFGNLRMFVLYLLSCNLSEILVVGIAILATLPLPLLPLQILFLNLVTDVFPAFALGAGEGDARVLDQPPRDPQEPIVGRRHWLTIIAYGLLITAATLGALVVAQSGLGLEGDAAVTLSFLTLALAQLWHVFNMRPMGSRLLDNELVRNPYVWGALVLCVGLLLGALFLPPVAEVLRVVPPDAAGWGVVILLSLAPTVIVQAVKSWAGRRPA